MEAAPAPLLTPTQLRHWVQPPRQTLHPLQVQRRQPDRPLRRPRLRGARHVIQRRRQRLLCPSFQSSAFRRRSRQQRSSEVPAVCAAGSASGHGSLRLPRPPAGMGAPGHAAGAALLLGGAGRSETGLLGQGRALSYVSGKGSLAFSTWAEAAYCVMHVCAVDPAGRGSWFD